jgi:hypothetical protein
LSKLPFTPKLRRFGLAQNGIVLGILGFSFFFFKKKKEIIKKKKIIKIKKGKLGWLWPPHTGCMGWPKPPPGLWGWSGHPERPHKKKKKKTKWVWGWLRPPYTSRRGWLEPPPWPKWGGPATAFLGKGVALATPDFLDFLFFFFFFNFLLFFKKKT